MNNYEKASITEYSLTVALHNANSALFTGEKDDLEREGGFMACRKIEEKGEGATFGVRQ